MRKIRKGTIVEWREHAKRFYWLRNDLSKALIEIQGLLPIKHTDRAFRAVQIIDEFRSNAQTEMFKRGGPQKTEIWYPANTPAGKMRIMNRKVIAKPDKGVFK